DLVAHDSHNIIAVGSDDESIVKAVNLIIENKGGVSVANKNISSILSLPVAGLMSVEDGYLVADKYESINKQVKKIGSNLTAPFMTLSFMALLVIPEIKLSDKGLFDGLKFEFTSLFKK
ncbi:MAG: adenine deaminase, partial [Bacteroidetes bacterium]|nr:adenine deaminase [Bacteroidota bacterium]